MVCRLRHQLLRSLLRQEIAFYDQNQTGELTNRLSADCNKISNLISLNLNILARQVGNHDMDTFTRFLQCLNGWASPPFSTFTSYLNGCAVQTIQLVGGMLYLYRLHRVMALGTSSNPIIHRQARKSVYT
jgi:ABC-type multidrug transport system fused ATPase/permease subunit